MESFLQTLRAVFRDDLANLNTMLIAKVVAVDMTNMRVDVKPVAMRPIMRRNNVDTSYTSLPLLRDIPLAFPRSGAAQIVHKVQVGDIVEVRLCQHSLDEILTSDDYDEVATQDLRRHDLQDAVAVPISFDAAPGTTNGSDYEIVASDVRIGNPASAKQLVTSDLLTTLNAVIANINTSIAAQTGTPIVTAVPTLLTVPKTTNLRGS